MNKLRNSKRKGFTLVEIIVVLVIIAILIAALAPVMIGWINEARETTIRTEGRTILLALQTVSTEVRAKTNTTLTRALLNTNTRFTELMTDADVRNAAGNVVKIETTWGTAGTKGAIKSIFLDAGGNIVGLMYGNPVRPTRDVEGKGTGWEGWLLIGKDTGTVI